MKYDANLNNDLNYFFGFFDNHVIEYPIYNTLFSRTKQKKQFLAFFICVISLHKERAFQKSWQTIVEEVLSF